jgi:hypothetical protein
MAYFNHAFQKAFLATGATVSSFPITKMDGSTVSTSTNGGFVTTNGVPTYGLNQLKAAGGETANGYIGIFDPKTNLTITPENCCNVYLAGSAIYSNDKIGPLTGGYQETNKSKMINPKYVSKYYSVTPCTPQNNVIHVGSTYWTAGGGALTTGAIVAGTGYAATGVTTVTGGTGEGMVVSFIAGGGTVDSVVIVNPGKGYTSGDVVTLVGGGNDATVAISSVTTSHSQVGCGTTANCCKEFFCGETYNLRVDIKGSPALRFLNHNAYYTVAAYTGCCPADSIAPVAVDSTEVMIKWANGITNYPIVAPFVQIVVQAEDGTLLYAPGTSATFLAANGAITWDTYVSTGHVDGACAGLILNGAYVDTKFGDCTFQLTDFYEVEPVRLYASEVDLNGDPCAFESLCVVTECQGLQVQGLGETILRELTMSESYRQSFLATDLRIREITQGNQIISSINRSGLYYRYSILHSVPRFNNPSGTFDNDQYMLDIFSQNALTTFNSTVGEWLSGCGVCELETIECETICTVPVSFPTLPKYNPYNTVACN